GNGALQPGNSYWSYVVGSINYPSDYNQNVPGAIYNTESGFEYPSTCYFGSCAGDPSPNPPLGVGTVPVTATTAAFSNAYNVGGATGLARGTNITGAGYADAGTRLAVQVTSIPNGSIVLVPQVIYLTNTIITGVSSTGAVTSVGNITGVM